ncbi:hypothetical protein QOZ80_4AG0305660 [Eleusine coracana subsp. coracana]|nr:hypothetical protein QOZ80_4AG0305660 [Eleusine coracana subsp. coracana]
MKPDISRSPSPSFPLPKVRYRISGLGYGPSSGAYKLVVTRQQVTTKPSNKFRATELLLCTLQPRKSKLTEMSGRLCVATFGGPGSAKFALWLLDADTRRWNRLGDFWALAGQMKELVGVWDCGGVLLLLSVDFARAPRLHLYDDPGTGRLSELHVPTPARAEHQGGRRRPGGSVGGDAAMQGSKSKSGSAESKSNGKPPPEKKGTPPTPKARKPAVPKLSAAHGTPPSAPRAADKSPGSADRKAATPKTASRLTTPPEKQGKAAKQPQEQPAAKPTQELQAQLAAVQAELMKAKEQLIEKEKETGKVLEELEHAKKVADEANAKLQRQAMETVQAEKPSSIPSEHAGIESMQRKLESMQSQQNADADALRSTVEQLEKARYELADAIDAKNEALNQADDATRAAEAKAEQFDLLNSEIKRLRELVDSKLDGKGKKTVERIQNLESENSKLKLELEKAKAAEERVVELEVRLEEAEQSNVLKGESLDSAMKELDTTSSLLRDRESEVAVLQDKVRLLEDDVSKQKRDIDISGDQLVAAEKEAADLWREVEELRLKLRAAEEKKMEALNSDGNSEIEALTEQKNQLAKELKASKDEVDEVKKAMEGLASALHEMSAESREAQEKYLTKQDEIERTQAQVEELHMSLKNTKENYEVMLDEANYEKVCLMKSVEKMEAEARNAHEEWRSKELSFVNSIKKSEEEMVSIRAQLEKTLEAMKERETENAELQEKVQQLEVQLIEANKIREEAKAETFQWKEKLFDKENELQNIKQENDDLQAKEAGASERIKELSSLLANVKDGTMTSNNQEEDKEKGGSEEGDEPVVVVAKMWEDSKYTDYDSSKEKENDGDSQADLESNKDDAALDINGLHSMTKNSGSTSPTKQHQHQKKRPLLKRFGGFLKKKSDN